MLGGPLTRAADTSLGSFLESNGFRITGGGGIAAQEFIPGPGGGRSGGVSVDITAVGPRGLTVRIQTIDTLGDGRTPTLGEAAAAARIREYDPNGVLILVPKPR